MTGLAQPRLSGGKEKVSRKIGALLMRDISVHDDGVYASGGVDAMLVGRRGSGKTTMELQIAAGVRHLKGNAKKSNMTKDTHTSLETVIWRGRKYDYWNTLLPENLHKSYPDAFLKPVHVHYYFEDELDFYMQPASRRVPIDFNNGCRLIPYRTAAELYRNLVKGANNVVYEPAQYRLPKEIIERITKRKLEIRRRSRRRKGDDEEEQTIPAPSSVFWFEFAERLIELKARDEFFTVIIDEAHQVFPASARGEHWHLVDWFANTVIDLRRQNVTLIPATHDTTLVDYRITYRMEYFLWMPGSVPIPGRTRVHPNLIGSLVVGEAVAELIGSMFGMVYFDQIPNQPPIVQVDGAPSFS